MLLRFCAVLAAALCLLADRAAASCVCSNTCPSANTSVCNDGGSQRSQTASPRGRRSHFSLSAFVCAALTMVQAQAQRSPPLVSSARIARTAGTARPRKELLRDLPDLLVLGCLIVRLCSPRDVPDGFGVGCGLEMLPNGHGVIDVDDNNKVYCLGNWGGPSCSEGTVCGLNRRRTVRFLTIGLFSSLLRHWYAIQRSLRPVPSRASWAKETAARSSART